MIRTILAAAAAVTLLAGCTPGQALSNLQAAGKAGERYAQELGERRVELRSDRRQLEDAVIACYQQAIQQVAADPTATDSCEEKAEIYRRAKDFIGEAYPDAAAVYGELGKARDARRQFLDGYGH